MVGKRKADAQPDNPISYETERNERLAQNRQRLLELGIPDLSSKLSSQAARNAKSRRDYNAPLPAAGAAVVRRSTRLQSAAPVSYKEPVNEDEVNLNGKRERWGKGKEGTMPEIYTDEHEKLLGSWEKPWDLFTDGCDASGSRIYDPVNGKTCHQCRQKTLGQRTWCSSCQALQGQFCGDCLFMRYGENVLEANENKKWVCPICRGICNCSLCRPKRGWAPTGSLYRKAIALGYKSVAHFLIYTRRAMQKRDEDVEEVDRPS